MSKPVLSLCICFVLVLALPTAGQPPAKHTDPALAGVPTDSFFFVTAKVSKLWDHPAAKSLRAWEATQKIGPLDQVIGLRASEIDRVTVFAASPGNRLGEQLLIITTRKAYDEDEVLKRLGVAKPLIQPKEGGRLRIYPLRGTFEFIIFADDTTLLYLPGNYGDKHEGANLLAKLITRKSDGPLAAALAEAEKHDVMGAINVRDLQDAPLPGPVVPLLKARIATLTADFDKSAKLRCTLHFPDAEGVKFGIKGLQDMIEAGEAQLARDSELGRDKIGSVVRAWALKLLKSAKIDRNGTELFASADVPFADDLAKLVAVLPKEFTAFRNDTAALNNLKQIALATHNFHDAYGFCPSDTWKVGDKVIPWSWRVQILPFIEENALYTRLNLMKPWDDPANLKILQAAEMPRVFEIPGRPAPKGHTYFRIFSLPKAAAGSDRPWLAEGERGPKLIDITDGTSNTLLVVETAEAVPWYKPDLLPYDGKLPLPQLGSKEAGRVLVCFGDGSTRSIPLKKLNEKTLRALITIQGGEPVEPPR